jgi:hypothetical protein
MNDIAINRDKYIELINKLEIVEAKCNLSVTCPTDIYYDIKHITQDIKDLL